MCIKIKVKKRFAVTYYGSCTITANRNIDMKLPNHAYDTHPDKQQFSEHISNYYKYTTNKDTMAHKINAINTKEGNYSGSISI